MVGSSSYQQESLEKTILAVVHAARKLSHYFQEHTVVVITQLSLRSTLRSTDYAGRIAKWGAVLGAFDIKYMPRTLVKGLVLAGLVARFAESYWRKKPRIKAWTKNRLAQFPCKNFYFGRNILVSSNLLKQLYRALAMLGPSDLLLRRTLAMSDPLGSPAKRYTES